MISLKVILCDFLVAQAAVETGGKKSAKPDGDHHPSFGGSLFYMDTKRIESAGLGRLSNTFHKIETDLFGDVVMLVEIEGMV